MFLLQNDKVEEANIQVAKIYKLTDEQIGQRIISDLQKGIQQAQELSKTSPTFIQSLTNINYRRASWMLIAIAMFNQLSGVNIVNMYSTEIFTKLLANGV